MLGVLKKKKSWKKLEPEKTQHLQHVFEKQLIAYTLGIST